MTFCLLWGLTCAFSSSCLVHAMTRDHYRHKLDVQAGILGAHREEGERRLKIIGQLVERLRAARLEP